MENFFMERAAQPWHSLPRVVGELSSLGVLKNVDVALGYML